MENVIKPIVYGARIKDNKILENSTSGGLFTAVSDLIIKNGGVVCGAIYDSNYEVKHVITNSKDIRDKMRGAKYVQSDMGNVISEILSNLKENRVVLFSGTPCQVVAVKNVAKAKKLDSNLITMDIICHGVPSPQVFKKHIELIEQKYGLIKSYLFRDKKKGWRGQNVTIITEKGVVPDKDAKIFTSLYFNSLIIRPSCFECPFSSVKREGDISIGDFWGISKEKNEFDDNLGISQVMLNSKKGIEIFNDIKKDLEFFEVKTDSFIQPNMQKPTLKNECSNSFWNKYYKKGLKNSRLFLDTLNYRLLPYRIWNKLSRMRK